MIECFLSDWKQGVYSMPKFLFHQALEVNNLPISKIKNNLKNSVPHATISSTQKPTV